MRIYIPRSSGAAAFDELSEVPWNELGHAYGSGIGQDPHEDVPGSLRLLGAGDEETMSEGLQLLFSNVCHQGTIYEVTAHAFPFIAAWAAGAPADGERLRSAFHLLAQIAIAATYDAPTGSHAGSWGDGVGETTRAAIKASAAHLEVVRSRSPMLGQLVAALLPDIDARRLQTVIDAAPD